MLSLTKYYSGDHIKKTDGEDMQHVGREKRFIQDFGGETRGKETT
jgi:hypothetical protein